MAKFQEPIDNFTENLKSKIDNVMKSIEESRRHIHTIQRRVERLHHILVNAIAALEKEETQHIDGLTADVNPLRSSYDEGDNNIFKGMTLCDDGLLYCRESIPESPDTSFRIMNSHPQEADCAVIDNHNRSCLS